MAQSNPFPPNIVGYSYFTRKSSPGTIRIYGEQHMYKKDIEAVQEGAFLNVVVRENFKYFLKMLTENPNSMLFMETSESLEANVASNTYSALKGSFPERVKNIDTRGLHKEDTPDERQRQFEYTKHLHKKYPAFLQKLKIDKAMSRSELLTQSIDIKHEAFIIEANALNDIELHKDIDIILYMGNNHRVNLSMYMNQHLDREFTQINNESIPPNDFVSAIFEKQDQRDFKEDHQRIAMSKTQLVEKSGSLRVRGRHPLRRSLLTY